jgi:hypothetical protein
MTKNDLFPQQHNYLYFSSTYSFNRKSGDEYLYAHPGSVDNFILFGVQSLFLSSEL